MKRKAKTVRKTNETDIKLEFTMDGSGISSISTPVPFLGHLLDSFTRHGNFDMDLKASGDIEVDSHHLIEDIGICLGKAIAVCLKDKKGIKRFGSIMLPMDEVEVSVSLDIGGRAYLRYDVETESEIIGGMNTSQARDFFRSLVDNSSINLHIKKNVGLDPHHIIEAVFKAFGIALYNATRISGTGSIPSTKGSI